MSIGLSIIDIFYDELYFPLFYIFYYDTRPKTLRCIAWRVINIVRYLKKKTKNLLLSRPQLTLIAWRPCRSSRWASGPGTGWEFGGNYTRTWWSSSSCALWSSSSSCPHLTLWTLHSPARRTANWDYLVQTVNIIGIFHFHEIKIRPTCNFFYSLFETVHFNDTL